MNSLYDGQSLQAYALRLQRDASRRAVRRTRSAAPLAPRLRALVDRLSH